MGRTQPHPAITGCFRGKLRAQHLDEQKEAKHVCLAISDVTSIVVEGNHREGSVM